MPNVAKSITLSEVKRHLYMDSDGKFRRKISHVKARLHEIAGGIDAKGYEIISLNSLKYRAHRLYYMYYHDIEELPDDVYIDHVNGIKNDNRKENLRISTHAQNCQNGKITIRNTTGSIGIYWHKRDKKWTAAIGHENKLINLGYFSNREDAEFAYSEAARRLHGNFSKV